MSDFEKFKQSVMEEFSGKLTEAKKETSKEDETKTEEDSEDETKESKVKQDTDLD
jgi:hypothetical protein